MSSKYVMANIHIPIEIKPDNSIIPLEHLSSIHIISIIQSIDGVHPDSSLPDILTQVNTLFREQEVGAVESIQESIQEPELQKQIWIRPEELRKTLPPRKINSSFKNRGNYHHRSTAKRREIT